jgi:hypothetical protein
MSNFVFNIITITGAQEEIDSFVQRFCVGEGKTLALSLQKALPLPRAPREGELAWARQHWGTPEVDGFMVMAKRKGRLELGFSSTDAPPFPVYEIYATAFPNLSFHARYADPANETAMAAVGKNGKLKLTELTFTEKIEEEFEPVMYGGEDPATFEETKRPEAPLPTAPQGFFELPLAPLKRWRFRRMQRSLVDYPPYTPPIQAGLAYLTAAEGKANFDFLMAAKTERLGHLRTFLALQGVTLEATPEGTVAVATWFDLRGGYLVPYKEREQLWRVWRKHAAPWTGRWAGLNVVLDITLSLGDRLIAAHPELQWMQYVSKRRRREPPSCENLPCIGGAPNNQPFSITEYMESRAAHLAGKLCGDPVSSRRSTLDGLNEWVRWLAQSGQIPADRSPLLPLGH